MLIKDSSVGKVFTEQDADKYLPIVSESLGYAQLCCYAVKLLRDNDIFASYEHICVALWKMFPKCERFHLPGYDDMPDTDYMEKLIKLRSTPKNQNYLTGGNFQGKTSQYGYEWQLTSKGETFAREVEEILLGQAVKRGKEKVRKSTLNYENMFKHLWESKLWARFQDSEYIENASAIEVAAALDFLYSSSSFADDVREIRQYYEKELKKAENEGISDARLEKTREFLKKIGAIKAVAKGD